MAGGAKINVISQISASVLAAIRAAASAMVTTTFTLAEGASDFFTTALILQKTSGNGGSFLEIKPQGTGTSSQIGLMSVDDETDYSIFNMSINDASECAIVSDKGGTKAVLPVGLWLGAKHHVFGIDGSITPDGPIIFKSSDIFMSTEQTGSGSAQTVAHGLGRTPVIFFAYPTSTLAAGAISATADGTNVTVTATNTLKYKVIAF